MPLALMVDLLREPVSSFGDPNEAELLRDGSQ
jgi:hypothetical protein